MFADLLPSLALLGLALLIALLGLRAMKKRDRNCGRNPSPCFWCGEDCDYYHLDKVA